MNRVHFENKKISCSFFWFIWFSYVVIYMAKNCFNSAMADIVNEGVMTKSQTGFITALFYIVYAPLQIFGGVFADKYNPEKLIEIGLLGGAIANLIIYFNQNYYVVLTVWVFNAIVQFAIWPSVFKIVSSRIRPDDRKKSTFYLSLSSTAGLLLAYLVAAIVPKWTYNFLSSSIVLFILTASLHFIAPRTVKYLVADETPIDFSVGTRKTEDISTLKLFITSGYFVLIAVSFIRTIVANSVKTLSPTMLMESYKNVSPTIGNLLNILIIIVGLMGTFMVKFVLYPKIIKSAPVGIAVMFSLSAVCCVVIRLIGKIEIAFVMIAMCFMSAVLTGVVLLTSYCTLRFEKFGKSGTAAGVMNAATSIGVVISSYGITKLAENFSWGTVANIFLILIIVSIILCFVLIHLWKKFKKRYFAS